ncbi:MAG TPA: hypothetical protein VGT24_01270 [Candidatus Acidoferrales bacterium]|nr:hypothetical protein [Candidatus Acidoferrales bacterium]
MKTAVVWSLAMSSGWLSNAWVIGIFSGIPSGLLVAFVSNYFLITRKRREHQQRVDAANRELVYAVRPGVSEGRIAARDVVLALRSSTARRYLLTATDLFTPIQVAEELVKEVMDSSFLSAAAKAEHCAQLIPLRTPSPPTDLTATAGYVTTGASRATIRFISLLLGGFVAALTGVLTGMDTAKLASQSIREAVIRFGLPIVLAFVALLGAVKIVSIWRDFFEREFVRLLSRNVTDKPPEDKPDLNE